MAKLDNIKSNSLTLEELKSIFEKAKQNANELFTEGCILLDAKRYARAHFLFRISCEEIGKSYITLLIIHDLICGKEIDWKAFWINFRAHKTKTRHAEIADMVLNKPFDLDGELKRIEEAVPMLEQFKLNSLYADYFEDVFYKPSELFTEQTVTLVKQAIMEKIDRLNIFIVEDYIKFTEEQACSDL